MNVASFFAGAGGIDIGFEQNGFKIVYANEFDEYPSQIYNANHSVKIDLRDIHDVLPEDVPDVDVIVGGFPCTSFSIAGYRKGFEDERSGDLFFELARIIKHKKPSIIFLENVKNLETHDNCKTFTIIKDCLKDMGYHIKYQVLDASKYGNIPQGRERIYIVGFLDEELCNKFEMPKEIPLTTKLSDVIDFNSKVDDKYYYVDGRIAEELKNAIDDSDAIYQWRRQYVRKNKSGVVPTLTANMGTGGHNVPIIKSKYGIRKLTPKECFNVQGYPKDYILPNLSNGRLYKASGNSVVVPVISRIAQQILKTIDKEN